MMKQVAGVLVAFCGLQAADWQQGWERDNAEYQQRRDAALEERGLTWDRYVAELRRSLPPCMSGGGSPKYADAVAWVGCALHVDETLGQRYGFVSRYGMVTMEDAAILEANDLDVGFVVAELIAEAAAGEREAYSFADTVLLNRMEAACAGERYAGPLDEPCPRPHCISAYLAHCALKRGPDPGMEAALAQACGAVPTCPYCR